ncbi:MAG: Succinyl-CoA ligase [ADP-forming] subunit alpha [Promethearchaeota archaeon]|nr:MAG: Succinyl-CoA ligase [ADP-forming] subunit alpha [Candidatus Lokiarchaeota archaeon]
MSKIDFFFNPKSVAIIGATSNPKKFGNTVTANILSNNNLKSEIFLISNRSQIIRGLRTYKSISDVKIDVELAILLVPASYVPKIIEECIQKRVKGIIINSAGFGEINEEGKKIEQKIVKRCKEAGIRVIGPNCVGIQNVPNGLNASFIQTPPQGNISMITQSGSFGVACLYEMRQNHLGCAKFTNLGNQIDISFNNILSFYKNDTQTKVICIYSETIANGKSFYNKIREVTPIKPVIVLKGGRTKMGMSAANSHTGSMASNYKIMKAAIHQGGALVCENMYDYITALKAYSFLPLPDGEKIGVLTNSGGSAVLFSDYMEKFGFQLADFSPSLKINLQKHLISLVKLVNPLDMIAGANEEQYYQVTKAMLEDDNIDIVVACTVIPPFLDMKSDEHLNGIIKAWNETQRKKPLIPLFLFGHAFEALKVLSEKEKLPLFMIPREAAHATKYLIERMRFLNSLESSS